PLSSEAQAEARILMLSANNILSPAHGAPLATPTQDMVLGLYYLTYSELDLPGLDPAKLDPRPRRYQSEEEVEHELEAGHLDLKQPIQFRRDGELVLTTPGRVIFNVEIERCLRDTGGGETGVEITHDFINRTLAKKEIGDLVSRLVDRYGAPAIATVLDTIKTLGVKYATLAGITISKNDIVIPAEKEEIPAGHEK